MKLTGLSSRHLADIRLIDLRLDLHMGEVLSDGEQLRCLEARGDGLPDFDRTLDDDAVDRRADIGALEIDAGAVEGRLVLSQRRLAQVIGRHPLVRVAAHEVVDRAEVALDQLVAQASIAGASVLDER